MQAVRLSKSMQRECVSAPARSAYRPGPMPNLATLVPMSATTARELPAGDEWVGEPKYDGIRLVARVEKGRAHLTTRNGKELTAEFSAIVAALEELARGRTLLLDGEVVAMRGGRPARFQMLQRRRLEKREGKNAFAIFDLLFEGKRNLMSEPWSVRRAALEALLKRTSSPHLLLSPTTKDLTALLSRARERGAEGIIAKRTDAPYQPGKRSSAWLKLKLEHEQEFVIGGWTPPQRSRPFLGALLVGYYEGETLIYAGKVGTGFTHRDLENLLGLLEKRERKTSPFTPPPRVKNAHWARPELVAEIRFTEWTRDGRLRHPAFLGLREDKEAREVVREPAGLAAP